MSPPLSQPEPLSRAVAQALRHWARPSERWLAAVSGGADSVALLAALRDLPEALEATIATRPAVAAAAQQLAPHRRYWAIVGNGANRVAAREIRIKLSELCYKSIACDSTEDKKHIDDNASLEDAGNDDDAADRDDDK